MEIIMFGGKCIIGGMKCLGQKMKNVIFKMILTLQECNNSPEIIRFIMSAFISTRFVTQNNRLFSNPSARNV